MAGVLRAFRVAPGRSGVVLEVPSGPAEEAVDALFPDYRTTASPPDAPVIRLRESSGGYELRSPDGSIWDAESLPAAVAALEVGLARALLDTLSGFVPLHAGAVATADGALLFPGPGASGKSSLTAGLAARGHPVYGDDVVLLEISEDGNPSRVHSFKRLLRVRSGARDALDLPPAPEPLASLWPEVSLYHPRDLGSAWADPAPVGGVVVPTRRAGAGRDAVRTPAGGAETMRELLPQLLLSSEPGAPHFELLARALEDATFERVTFRESPDAVELITREWEPPGPGAG